MTEVDPQQPLASVTQTLPVNCGTQSIIVLAKIEETIREAGPHDKITDLVLDEIKIGSFTNDVHDVLSRCHKLTYLSLESCEIGSLDNFVIFPRLEILELGFNT